MLFRSDSLEMVRALGLPREHVLHVHTELPLEQAATRYHEDLARFLEHNGRITAAWLGLGADGHTCSLFTPEDLERAPGRYAAAVSRPAGPARVTVTPALLERVERAVFVVAGAEKKPVVERLLSAPEELVAGRAVARCPRVELWWA